MSNYFHDTTSIARFKSDKMSKVNLYESPRLFCDVYCLEPGQEQKAHEHADNDKIYHMLTGTCEVRIGDETRSLSQGKVAIAPAGVVHALNNRSDSRATVFVVMAPHPDYQSAAR